MAESADDMLAATEVVERLEVVHSMIAAAQAEEIDLMTRLYRLRRAQQLALGVGALYAGEDAATEIGIALRVSQRSVDGLIGVGLGLAHRYPVTRADFSAGRLDLARVRAISDVLTNASDDLVAVLEPRIAAYAETAEPQRVRRTLRRWLLEADPAGQAARRKAAEADRYVKVTAADDGTAQVEAVLPAAGGQALYERLREMAVTQCCGRDPRTTSQRRADALVALADGSGQLTCRCGHSDCPRAATADPLRLARKALVQVGVSAETLAGLRDNPALLAGFGAIDADLARQIARHARFTIITDTDNAANAVGTLGAVGTGINAAAAITTVGAGINASTTVATGTSMNAATGTSSATGTSVAAGANSATCTGSGADTSAVRGADAPVDPATIVENPSADSELRYRPGARVAARVRALDGGCRAPGCAVPAAATDLDHQDRFDHANPENGGRTVEANLGCRCRRHHRLKTLADNGVNGWQVVHHPYRTVEWRTPTGGSVTTTPEGAKFLFPGLPVPPLSATGVPDAEPVQPLIDPGPVTNAMTELVHVYCTPTQRRKARTRIRARRTATVISSLTLGATALDDDPPF
ncbi:DUF222 domain-containing protein [Nocardia sp. NPDC059246]|uniref:HNH endonuclease signature motif containing protein n=1 Tax=unclassified Nocardia TaxID=2637762 RepID=UPI0036D06A02